MRPSSLALNSTNPSTPQPERLWGFSLPSTSRNNIVTIGFLFKSEKANPLDGLKSGDKVMFRLHERHYLNGKVTLMAIPYADNPNKEVEFSTRFEADVVAPPPTKPTDNVKAMWMLISSRPN